MRRLRNILLGFVVLLLLVNLLLIITEKTYLYKGVANTYLKGRTGPAIDEYGIFESRTIKAGNPQPWPLSPHYNTWQMSYTSDSLMRDYETVSFLVIRRDSILYEKYWEYYDKNTISNSFSMAKTIVGILTGIALKEGYIKSIDQPVADFIPEFAEDERKDITIRHLLTMSSGIDFDEHYSSPFAYPAAAYYGKNLNRLTLGYRKKTDPGKQLDYQSGTSQLLAIVLENATGQRISDYASEKLWVPIGAVNDARWNLDNKDGMEKAFCCFIATTRDFARFGKLYQDKGNWNGTQIVDSSFVEESLRPAPLSEADGTPQDRYGFKWWLMNLNGNEIFYMRGIYGQYVWVIPDKELIVVRLGRKRAANQGNNHPVDMFLYLNEALEIHKASK